MFYSFHFVVMMRTVNIWAWWIKNKKLKLKHCKMLRSIRWIKALFLYFLGGINFENTFYDNGVKIFLLFDFGSSMISWHSILWHSMLWHSILWYCYIQYCDIVTFNIVICYFWYRTVVIPDDGSTLVSVASLCCALGWRFGLYIIHYMLAS